MTLVRKNKKTIFLFLLPALLIYIIFEVLPALLTIYFSFHDWNGIQSVPLQFVGMKNYAKLFSNKAFLISIRNVLLYVLIGLLTQLPIGFGLGIAIYNAKYGKRFLKASFFIPMILSVTAVSLLWYFIYFPTDRGLLNTLLMNLRFKKAPTDWLNERSVALLCVAVVSTWTSIGYYMIICMSGLAAVPTSVYDAAKLDGSTGLHRVFHVDIPLIWSSVRVSIIMIITGIIKMFDTVYILTPNGGPGNSTNVPALLMYNESFKYNKYGKGSAIATIILAMSILVSVISLKLTQQMEDS